MKNKIIEFDDSRAKMRAGVSELNRAVASTLGPKGRNVVLYFDGKNMSTTKDGVTVSRFIRFSDPIKDAAAKFLQDAAVRTVFEAGDGTTTATILTASIFEAGAQFLEGKNYLMRQFNEGVNAAVENAINELVNESEQLDGDFNLIEQVARISANNDVEMGQLIRSAMEQVGVSGTIQVADSTTNKSHVKVVDGMEVQSGFLDYSFINTSKKAANEMGDDDNPVHVFIVDDEISTIKQITPMLQYVLNSNINAVLVVNELVGEAEAMVRVNREKNNLQLCVVRAPGAGERRRAYSRDLAVYTGASVIGQDTGTEVENFVPEMGGLCRRFVATSKTSRFIEGAGSNEDVEELISSIQAEIENTKDEFAISKHKQRIQRLRGKAAVLMLGAKTEQEFGQLKDRVDDAVKATQASIEEGIVPGGGTTYLKIAERLKIDTMSGLSEAWNAGYNAVVNALRQPFIQIVRNAGEDYQEVMRRIASHPHKNMGYDAVTGNICDLREKGIINATKVERVALINAASSATLMLSTECIIYPDPENPDNGQ